MIPLFRRSSLVSLVAVAALTLAVAPAGQAAPRVDLQRGRGGVAPAAAAPGLLRTAERRPGELLVRRAPGSAGLERALAQVNGHAVRSLGHRISLVAVPPGQEEAAAAALAADPAILSAAPNYVRSATSHAAAEVGWGVRRIQAPRVWHTAPRATGAGIRVAVIDSGVDKSHPQLAGRVVRGQDMYGGAGKDDCGHGTAVAGVIAAAADGRSSVGVAPDATIVPVKVLRFDPFEGCSAADAEIVAGIHWAADPDDGNADIINLSLSGPQRSSLLRDAIRYATRQGVLVIGAAGNTGDREIQFPAAYPEVVSVGGIQRSQGSIRAWPYTSFAKVDVSAAAKAVPVIIARNIEPSAMSRPCPDRDGRCSDGTSFAAPHVAGAAALMAQLHDTAQLGPVARVRRLRQWLLATAPRVPGRHGGMDLKTGHGSADALAARAASNEASRVLLTWQTTPRIVGPTRKMTAANLTVRATLLATRGTGAVLANRDVDFAADDGGSVDTTRRATSDAGRVAATFKSTAAGTVTTLTAEVASRSLSFDTYVLQRDDNVPGVRPPSSPFRNKLDPTIDIDDVFRIYLRDGETLRARLRHIDQRREYGDLFLHRGSTRDVTNPFLAPLSEPSPYDNNPRVLRRRVKSDGVRFLDVYGFGTYRLQWSIYSPRIVRRLSADPASFAPGNDGYRDVSRLSWRLARRGRVVVRIRNSAGRVVRVDGLGREKRGERTWRWNGRNNDGRLVREGTYRAVVQWEHRTGRVSRASTRITVNR